MLKPNLSVCKIKNVPTLDTCYNNTRIKQHSWITKLSTCILEETMSGESMAHKVIRKVNTSFYISEK